jgi:hypothetical protein
MTPDDECRVFAATSLGLLAIVLCAVFFDLNLRGGLPSMLLDQEGFVSSQILAAIGFLMIALAKLRYKMPLFFMPPCIIQFLLLMFAYEYPHKEIIGLLYPLVP